MTSEEDYKAFIIPIHPDHGILLLYCTRKKSKGPHHQLPGGHVDKEDFDEAGKSFSLLVIFFSAWASVDILISFHLRAAKINQIGGPNFLLHACKIGAARELFEETGMDLRTSLDRLTPVQVRKSCDDEETLSCQFKKRVFFSVDISDADLFTKVRYGCVPFLLIILQLVIDRLFY